MMNAFCGGVGWSNRCFSVTGVVWLRRTAFSASARSHVYRHPSLPVRSPFSCTSATRRTTSSSGRPRRGFASTYRVSRTSRAGWSWGWNRASKFQNAGWTQSPEISVNPIPRKIRRIFSMYSVRMWTFPGWIVGANVRTSYGRISTDFHFPLRRSSGVSCATSSFSSMPCVRTFRPASVREISRRTVSRSATMSLRDRRSFRTAGSISSSVSSPFASRAITSSSRDFDSRAASPRSVTETTDPSGPRSTVAQPFFRIHPSATENSSGVIFARFRRASRSDVPCAFRSSRRSRRSGRAFVAHTFFARR